MAPAAWSRSKSKGISYIPPPHHHLFNTVVDTFLEKQTHDNFIHLSASPVIYRCGQTVGFSSFFSTTSPCSHWNYSLLSLFFFLSKQRLKCCSTSKLCFGEPKGGPEKLLGSCYHEALQFFLQALPPVVSGEKPPESAALRPLVAAPSPPPSLPPPSHPFCSICHSLCKLPPLCSVYFLPSLSYYVRKCCPSLPPKPRPLLLFCQALKE